MPRINYKKSVNVPALCLGDTLEKARTRTAHETILRGMSVHHSMEALKDRIQGLTTPMPMTFANLACVDRAIVGAYAACVPHRGDMPFNYNGTVDEEPKRKTVESREVTVKLLT